jgi:3-oxoacyl-[acyl-carrier protein] reductase
MEKRLTGKVAVVTGATSGIGKAVAKRLASEGAFVSLWGQSEERGKQAVLEIGSELAQFSAVDVTQADQVTQAIDAVTKSRGDIDILVNCAGITHDGLLLRLDEEDWDRVITTNLKSCFLTCRAVLRGMIKKRKGKIVNLSSVVGIMGNAGQGNYAASKAAIIGLTKSLAKEVASRNICVNCIAPGFIETPMTDKLDEGQKKAIVQEIPLGRMGKAEEIAEMALFLVTPAADYITGQVLVVDGGLHI